MSRLDETPRIIGALQHIDSSDRETWVRCGMAIRAELGEAGFDVWNEWSRSAPNYNERDACDVWRSFGDSGPVGLGTLYHLAREGGWNDSAPHRELSPEEVENRRRSREEADAKDREERQRVQAQAVRWAGELLAGTPEATGHDYLDRKKLKPTSTLRLIDVGRVQKLTGWTPKGKAGELQGNLLAARCVRPGSGVAVTLELIDSDGRKAGLPGRGTRTGAFWPTSLPLPKPAEAHTLLVGEGTSTTLSGTQATGIFGAAALSASNLKNVALGLRQQYPNTKIIILADLIKETGKPDPHAVEAARSVGGLLAVPDFGPGRKPDQKDVNDLLVLRGPEAVKVCIERAAPVEPEQTEQQAPIIWDAPADIATMMTTEPDPMSWLIKDRIPLGRGGALSALGGTGKTSFLKSMGIGCITGHLPMDGWEIERTGKVVLVLTEDTHAEFHEDLHRLCYSMTTRERELIARNLVVYPLAGKDTRLLVKSPRGVVEKSALYQTLVAKIQAIGGVELVGLDPALGITEGDELNQADQRALGRAVDDLAVTVGATCILLTHSSKGLLNAEELGSHSSRGGGALTDALRFEITMRGMTAKEATAHGIEDLEERLHLVQVAITKGNRVPPSAKVPVWLRYDSGTLVSAGLVEPEKKSKADGIKLPKSAALAFEAIKEATMERGQIDDATGRPYVAMDDIRTVHKDLYTQRNPANGDRAERKALQDGTSKLAEIGWIKSDGLTVAFSGPGVEAHVQNILAAMAERRGRNCGTERNFSELSSAKGTEIAEPNGTSPLYRGSSGSEKFRGDFDQKEVKPEIPSPGTSQIVEGEI